MSKSADVKMRFATQDDITWLLDQERNIVDKNWVKRCLDHREYIVAHEKESENQYLGYIRFSYFWGKYPYLDMISIVQNQQGRGIGNSLYLFWEDQMRRAGFKTLVTSSFQNLTDVQNWHWRNGFREAGKLTLGKNEPNPEIFFVKELE